MEHYHFFQIQLYFTEQMFQTRRGLISVTEHVAYELLSVTELSYRPLARPRAV